MGAVNHRESLEFRYDWFVNDKRTDTQEFIAGGRHQAVIGVRGTEPTGPGFRDWLTDLHAQEVPFEEGAGQIHAGSYRSFKIVKPVLDEFLQVKHAIDNKLNVLVCGHSLGGAIATLIGAYLRRKTDRVMVYTFGSPRVGDRTFATTYSRGRTALNYFRVVNANDIVTMVPLPGMDLRPYMLPLSAGGLTILPLVLADLDGDPYTHAGRLVHIRKQGAAPDGSGVCEYRTGGYHFDAK